MGLKDHDPFLPDRVRPVGMPYATRRLVVGYRRPVTDPLLLELITNSHLVEPFQIFLRDVVEARGEMELDVQSIEAMARSVDLGGSLTDITASQIWLWLKHLIEEIYRYKVGRMYHQYKRELLAHHRSTHLEVLILPDKVVFELHGYYPLAEGDFHG